MTPSPFNSEENNRIGVLRSHNILVEYLNKWWVNYSGMAFEPTTIGQVANESIHPDDAPRLMATFQQAVQQAQGFAIEQRNRSASGEYRWFLNAGEPYCDPKTGQITRWMGMSIDIDDRKQAEEALRQSESQLRAVLESMVCIPAKVPQAFRSKLTHPACG